MRGNSSPLDLLQSEAAWIFEAAKRSLATKDAIVAWADSKIMQLDSPPYWLIEISTLRSDDLRDHASLIRPHLAGELPVAGRISLVASVYFQHGIPLDRALELLFKVWIPNPHEPKDTPAAASFDWEPLADLLVEWDMRHFDQDFPDNFVLRCQSALSSHLEQNGHPPSTIFHPPSPI